MTKDFQRSKPLDGHNGETVIGSIYNGLINTQIRFILKFWVIVPLVGTKFLNLGSPINDPDHVSFKRFAELYQVVPSRDLRCIS